MAPNHVQLKDEDDDVGEFYLYIAERAFEGAAILRRLREQRSNHSTGRGRQNRRSDRSTDLDRPQHCINRPTVPDVSDMVPDAVSATVGMRIDGRIGEDRQKVRELTNLHSDVPETVDTYLYSVGILHHGRRPKLDKRARDDDMAFHKNAIRELVDEKVKEKADTLRLMRLTPIDRGRGLAGALLEDTRPFRLLQLYWRYAMDLPNDVEYELLLKCCVNMDGEDIQKYLSERHERTSNARLWKRFMELDREARVLQQPGWVSH
ncbi:MAG: hypothetical protein M1831_000735 [Alyxoria varia]|nr:MAG: hypothetical protein M1831_000735 [Alyxoria varia]